MNTFVILIHTPMIGIVFIYFIGKFYYDLANKYHKSQWGFAALGVASYYGGTFIGGIILGVIAEIYSPGYVESLSNIEASLIALPAGVLACWGMYQYLKYLWSRPSTPGNSDQTLDSNLK